MKVYKHVLRKYADDFQSGAQIALRTLENLRTLETDRVDTLEGSAVNQQSDPDRNPTPFEMMRGLSVPGVQFRQTTSSMAIVNNVFEVEDRLGDGHQLQLGPSVVFRGNTFIERAPECYVFCCSIEPDFGRIDIHDEVIFEIDASDLIGGRIRRENKTLLSTCRAGIVSYQQRTAELFKEPVTRASPFAKDPFFSYEKEFRVVWQPMQQPTDGLVVLSSSRFAKLLRRLA